MDSELAIAALRRTGQRLEGLRPPLPTVSVFVVGGVAGMLSGQLDPSRTTGDCDVIEVAPDNAWDQVSAAAREVAAELRLNSDWLNRKAAMFAWELPMGWRRRSQRFADYGPLRVMLICRGDLIAAKVMGAPQRVQDRDDLVTLKPTAAELDAVAAHLDRVEAESDPGRCASQRTILEWLRAQT